MRKRDLYVYGHGDGVADQHVEEAMEVGVYGFVDDEIAEPVPEESLAGHFEVAMPPGGTFARTLTQENVLPGEDVEVETAEGEDGVVQIVLVFEYKLCERVVGHDSVVIC